MESEPPLPDTASVTVYVPGELYVYAGLCSVESSVPSLSKSHDQESTSPVEPSVKVMAAGAMPSVADVENSAAAEV